VAPLVLCLHGLTANCRAWDFLGQRLAGTGKRAVALDLRGRALTATSAGGTTGGLDGHVADLVAAATALGAETFDVCGWSMGALIGILAASTATGRLRRLVLIDTASAYFRAFHGIPTTVTSPDGRPVNAVRGLLDVIAHIVATRHPDELVCCWDVDWRPRWRVELVPNYKAHRVASPDGGSPGSAGVEEVPGELVPQVGTIREVLAAAAPGCAVRGGRPEPVWNLSGSGRPVARSRAN
jgi:pimeloyl-ACP methyl ester carboxylesterase